MPSSPPLPATSATPFSRPPGLTATTSASSASSLNAQKPPRGRGELNSSRSPTATSPRLMDSNQANPDLLSSMSSSSMRSTSSSRPGTASSWTSAHARPTSSGSTSTFSSHQGGGGGGGAQSPTLPSTLTRSMFPSLSLTQTSHSASSSSGSAGWPPPPTSPLPVTASPSAWGDGTTAATSSRHRFSGVGASAGSTSGSIGGVSAASSTSQIGQAERALGYDSLLGHRPKPASSSSPMSPPLPNEQGVSRSSGESGVNQSRDPSPSERGGESIETQHHHEIWAPSTTSSDKMNSASSVPTPQIPSQERNKQPSKGSAAQHSYFTNTSTNNSEDVNKINTSSETAANLLSPLSPFVEPFSPSLTGPQGNQGFNSTVSSQQAPQRIPHQQKEQQQHQQQRTPLIGISPFLGKSPKPNFSLSNNTLSSDAAAVGFSDRQFPGLFSNTEQPVAVSSTSSSFSPRHRSFGSDSSGTDIYQHHQNQLGYNNSIGVNPVYSLNTGSGGGVPMIASTSKDGYTSYDHGSNLNAGLGLMSPGGGGGGMGRLREMPSTAIRGGNITRAGYAEAAARGLSVGGSGGPGSIGANSIDATLGVGGGLTIGGVTGTGPSGTPILINNSNPSFIAAPASSNGEASGPSSSAASDEISTIFVVGFPEDMLEREFQNMFVFSNGFEAATLKVPAATLAMREREQRERERDQQQQFGNIGNNIGFFNQDAPVSPSVGTGPGGGGGGPASVDGGAWEDAFGNRPLDTNLIQSSLASTRETAGSPLNGVGGSGSNNPGGLGSGGPSGVAGRKQIIGFAKFRTRSQALAARDTLSGKKVDAERGCILKAEMAKKNLHTKRGLSNETSGSGVASSPALLGSASEGAASGNRNLNPLFLADLARQNTGLPYNSSAFPQGGASSSGRASLDQERDARAQAQQAAAYDAFHSVPSPTMVSAPNANNAPSLLGGDREREPTGGSANSFKGRSSKDTGSIRDAFEEASSPSLQPSSAGAAAYSSKTTSQSGSSQDRRTTSASPPTEYPSDILHSPGSASSGAQPSSPNPRSAVLQSTYAGKSMLQQLDEGVADFQRGYPQVISGDRHLTGYSSPLTSFGGQNEVEDLYSFPPSQSVNIYNASRLPGNLAMPSQQQLNNIPQQVNNVIPRTQNPADMNAPKNTLYVGGLPAVLPSLTGPFSAAHLEESLRSNFSRCPGFRRLCFRSKSNGPIVFVEFDDVLYATRALQEMYGNTLGGIVKGGIRLSYSKNPLGVRAGANSNGGSGQPNQGHFGQDSDKMFAMGGPPQSGYGVSPALQQQSQFQHHHQHSHQQQRPQQQQQQQQQQQTGRFGESTFFTDTRNNPQLSSPIPSLSPNQHYGSTFAPFGFEHH